ncbi:ATP-dependent helicase [Candidatus Saccharibacteria bacterium]|nr:ATP-dependent helicase [Candidatus Saccharibacteria bacterium]
MQLNEQQKQAVEYLEGPLLVLAGPGTGKTQLLSEKVAYILKTTDANPENILCMTFTDSGATNMRERLKTIVGKAGAKVNVNTYHTFGSDILAQYKNYSETYDRRLDSPIDEITQFKIVKNLQSELPPSDILHGDNVKNIIDIISSAKSANLTAEDLKLIAEQNAEDSKILSSAISPLLSNLVPYKFKESYENAYQPIYELLKNYEESAPLIALGEDSSTKIERSISILARDLKDAIILAESDQKLGPLSNWKDTYFEKDGKGNYRLSDRIANKKLLSVANLMGRYNSYLKDNGLYDFDDMIEEAVKILKNDEGFRATLSERYQFIMLDEFQDTNPSQFAIIKELTKYEKPVIMAVGDDDQAIYEFQGALSTNLTDFQNHYNAKVIPLTENYRSTQEILDFSREIINQAPDRFADKALTAHQKDPKTSQISRYEFMSSDMECAFVANKIDELIKSGVDQNEIAVISYKTKYFMPLLPFLKSHPAIKIAYDKRDNLLENEEMHQLFTLSRYVYELANERNENVSIMEILSYPFFKLPMLEVIKQIAAAKYDKKSVFEYLAKSENPEIQQVTKFIADLVSVSFTEPLEIFLDYLIGASELNGYRSPFLKHYSTDDYQTFALYENLAALRGKLNKHFGDKSLKLADLITMLDDYIEAEMPLTITSPYRDADSAVSLLSAHKAKGLEFEYVFILSADHLSWGKGKGNNNTLALPSNLKQIRHTGMTDGERLRILYVALTRAKHTLFITNALRDFSGKSPARLEYLEEYTEGDKVYSPFLPDKEVKTIYNVSDVALASDNLKNWLNTYTADSPDMRAIYKERIKNYKMSASSLTSFIDIVYAGPQEFFKNYILGAPREPETEYLAFGNLIHQTFEEVTNKNISDEEAVQYFLNELDKRELATDIKQSLREKGPANLAISLKEFGKILRQGKAEINFGPEKLTIEGVPVVGKIDHITIDDKAKTIEIYDYKTGGYHKEKWQSHATLYKYMLQLGFYKLLLNNSPTYKNYKVEKAHILFVTPDQDGLVYDKVYEFNSADEKALVNLMVAVYNQTVSLKFIDDPEIFVPANDKLGLKDIKQFIELLLAK